MNTTSRALAFASLWFDPATVDRVFAPLVADWQREWQDAAAARRLWVSARGLSAFAFSFAILVPRIVVTPTPSHIRRNVTVRIAMFCLIVGGLFSIPLVQAMATQSMEPLSLPMLMLFALPASLTVAFPFAMAIAVDGIRRGKTQPPQVERATAVKLAATAFVVMTLASGVIVPAANQAWRERSTPVGWNVPGPSFNQSSTMTLLTHPDRSGPIVPGRYTRAGVIRRELVGRVVMSILPAVLIWLRWEGTNRRRRAWFAPLPGMLATVGGILGFFTFWLAGTHLELRGLAPFALGLWTPVVGMIGVGLGVRLGVTDYAIERTSRLYRMFQNSRIA